MSESASGIMPLFRSEAQLHLLAQLFGADRPELTVGELARRAGVSQQTTSREIARLVDHGVVVSRLVGRSRLVRANWDLSWATDIAGVLAKTVGVPGQLAAALGGLVGVKEAFIFGSWAARSAGVPGPPPRDIDVAVVGDADFDAVRHACVQVEDSIGAEINPIVVSVRRWERPEADDGFITTIQGGPLVGIPLSVGAT